MAAASMHDTIVLTRENNREAIEAALRTKPATPVHFEYLDLPTPFLTAKRWGLPTQIYYLFWQVLAFTAARRLHRQNSFDIVHHLTFAVDWMPAGVLYLTGTVKVWGPVGGATSVPPFLYKWLGVRGAASEVFRRSAVSAMRRIFGHAMARRSDLTLLQNRDGVRHFEYTTSVSVEPNVVVPTANRPRLEQDPEFSEKTAVYVGRLIPWKGVAIALAALARPESRAWTLRVIGEGPDVTRLTRMAKRMSVDKRVRFEGRLAREQALEAIAEADCLLFPSMHDAAGFVVAEAVSMGTPVIALGLGGPPEILTPGHVAIRASADLVDHIVHALSTLPPVLPSDKWDCNLLSGRIDRAYMSAMSARIEHGPTRRDTSKPL